MCVKMGGRKCGKRLIIHLSASKSVNRMNEVRGKLAGKYNARPVNASVNELDSGIKIVSSLP